MAALMLAAMAGAALADELPLPDAGTHAFKFGDALVTVTVPDTASRNPYSISVSAPGARPATLTLPHVPGQHEFPPKVQTVEMDGGNAVPEILVTRYSGGAHCCADIRILDLVQGAWRIVPGGSWDGDGVGLEDVDGDGEMEIVHGDDRFLYVFTCYACAGTPERRFKLVDGALAEITASPLLRARDEKRLPDFEKGCADRDNGACAGYVALMDRLGRHDEGWAFMLKHYDPRNDWGLHDCAAYDAQSRCIGDIRYRNYPDALTALLQRIGDRD